MEELTEEFLSLEPFCSELEDYIYMPSTLCRKIPKYSIVKYINRNLDLHHGGMVIDHIASNQIEEKAMNMMIGGRCYKLNTFFNYIFYRESTNSEKMAILHKRRRKPTRKRNNKEFFKQLLESL